MGYFQPWQASFSAGQAEFSREDQLDQTRPALWSMLSTSFAPTVNIEAGNLDQGLLDMATASKELVVIHCDLIESEGRKELFLTSCPHVLISSCPHVPETYPRADARSSESCLYFRYRRRAIGEIMTNT